MSQNNQLVSKALEIQQNTLENSQKALADAVELPMKQSIELQKNAAKLFLDGLEMTNYMQNRNTELTRDAFTSYINSVEDTVQDTAELAEQGIQGAASVGQQTLQQTQPMATGDGFWATTGQQTGTTPQAAGQQPQQTQQDQQPPQQYQQPPQQYQQPPQQSRQPSQQFQQSPQPQTTAQQPQQIQPQSVPEGPSAQPPAQATPSRQQSQPPASQQPSQRSPPQYTPQQYRQQPAQQQPGAVPAGQQSVQPPRQPMTVPPGRPEESTQNRSPGAEGETERTEAPADTA